MIGQSESSREALAAHGLAVQESLRALDLAAVERLACRLRDAARRGAMILGAGNGGSAATASHWVNDLCKATRGFHERPFRAMCLTDNAPWLTALANDEGYERVFAEQVAAVASPGDVLVLISCSGSSANLLRAAEAADVAGCETLAFLGFDGGALRTRVSDHVLVPTPRGAYELVEDVHGTVCHMVVRFLTAA